MWGGKSGSLTSLLAPMGSLRLGVGFPFSHLAEPQVAGTEIVGPLGDAVSFVDAGEGHGRQPIGEGQAAGSRSASANQGLGGQQQHLHLALLHLHREHRRTAQGTL